MATFGAKILHPTTAPAQRAKIPVFVGSSYEPEKDGTWIKPNVDSTPLVMCRYLEERSSTNYHFKSKNVNGAGF